MHKFRVALSLIVLTSVAAASAGTIDSDLDQILSSRAATDTVSTLVFAQEQVDIEAVVADLDQRRATLQERHETVVRLLQSTAAASQAKLVEHLRALEAAGRVSNVESYWISNAIRVDASAAEIRLLAKRPDVGIVYFNYPITDTPPVSTKPAAGPGSRSPEAGLVAMNVPEAWAMGYTGAGVLVSTLDTGVDGSHPALASRWAGVADPRYAGHPQWAWHDSLGSSPGVPTDSGTHGTHTMGTVCGGAPGDQIGVAPGAFWIADNSIGQGVTEEFYSDVISAYQWLIDPDFNPYTNWDVPAVCSNSWGVNEWWDVPPCDEFFWSALDACEASGIVILFAAGNEGTSGLRRPSDRATDEYRTCAVAAVDANTAGWPIADFSSRGPTYCTPDGSAAIKPDISAPGEDVRSAVPGGGYGLNSGTSMAAPHANGVVALMREACPDLTVPVIKQILYDTAYDLGPAGKDNSYGWGMIDAQAAVQMALDMCGPRPPRVADVAASTPYGTPVGLTLIADDDELPDPPAAVTYIVTTLPEHGQLSDAGDGAIMTVPYTLVDGGAELVYTPEPYFGGDDTFLYKANDGGAPPEGGDSEEAVVRVRVGGPRLVFEFPLDADPNWGTTGQWAFGQPAGQGSSPHFGYPDPLSGATGSYVYGVNLEGDYATEIGGPYYVTLGPLDLSPAAEVSVKFQRWLNTDFDPYVHTTVEASGDGSEWIVAWSNGDAAVTDNAWTQHAYDISAAADGSATAYVRWGYEIDAGAYPYSGWNLDDVEIWGVMPLTAAPGDLDCDGDVDFDDIDPFVLALSGQEPYEVAYPGCIWLHADCNGDGDVGFDDIDSFVALLAK